MSKRHVKLLRSAIVCVRKSDVDQLDGRVAGQDLKSGIAFNLSVVLLGRADQHSRLNPPRLRRTHEGDIVGSNQACQAIIDEITPELLAPENYYKIDLFRLHYHPLSRNRRSQSR